MLYEDIKPTFGVKKVVPKLRRKGFSSQEYAHIHRGKAKAAK